MTTADAHPTVCVDRNFERPGLLIVGNFLSGAGGRRGVCEELAERLRDAGWRVQTTSHHLGRVRRLFEMLRSVWFWRRTYSVAQVDVFSGPAFLWAAATVALLRVLGKPAVFTLRGGNLPSLARRWPRLVQFVLGRAAVVTAPSAYLAREMASSRKDILVLPNPLEIAQYPFAVRSTPRPRLIWLRAFHEVYNPSLAPQVLSLLAVDFPGVTLTMIGPDKGDGSLSRTTAAAERLGMTSRLTIVAGIPKDKVGQALSDADIFLNTTNVDNSPVTVVEAMACGLCVVSTNVGGMPDLVCDGEDGLLVPPRDAGAMAAAIRSVLTDSTLSARLSKSARQKAEALDWSAAVEKWERVLRDAAFLRAHG